MDGPLNALIGLRRRLGVALHRRMRDEAEAAIVAARAQLIADASAQTRHDALRHPRIFGPEDRVHVHETAEVNDALFNTVSGTITVEEHAFFGHDVAVLTGTHDITALGEVRKGAIPVTGNDIVIGAGAWVSSRAVLLGPCHVGANAVVAAGAIVTGDVASASVVAGVPARPVGGRSGHPAPKDVAMDLGLPPAVDLQTEAGRLYAHRDDQVITPALRRSGRWEGDEPEFIAAALVDGDVVVDVGANIGYMTLVAAEAIGPSGHVLAIEPDASNAALLGANVRRNGLDDRVTVLHAAAWSCPGVVELNIATENTGDHRVDAQLPERASVRVPAVRLDDIVNSARRVRLVKLDTQGTEHLVLQGAQELLARDRPTILLEFWPTEIRRRGDQPDDVLRAYRAHGYAISVVDEPSVDASSDRLIIEAMDRRPAPFGGFGTLRLDPIEVGPGR